MFFVPLQWHLSSPLFLYSEPLMYPHVLFLLDNLLTDTSFEANLGAAACWASGPRCPLFLFKLKHTDLNVQFIGAHTTQVKISHDWYAADTFLTPPNPHPCPLCLRLHRESLPTAHSDQLVPFLLNITRPSIVLGLSKVILRKFFVTVCLCSHYHPFSFIH